MSPLQKISLPIDLDDLANGLNQSVCECGDCIGSREQYFEELEAINKQARDVLTYIRELRKELDLLQDFADRQRKWSYLRLGRDLDDIPEHE